MTPFSEDRIGEDERNKTAKRDLEGKAVRGRK